MVVGFDVRGKWSLHVYDRKHRRAIANYRDTTVFEKKAPLQIAVGPAVPESSAGTDKSLAAVLHVDQSNTPNHAAVRQQQRAQFNLEHYSRPAAMSEKIFDFLVDRTQRDHPGDFETQLYVLDGQMAAYELLVRMTPPEAMATSHFNLLKNAVASRHPYDFATQRYLLNHYIDEYLMQRMTGTNGDEIVAALLRR
jgi:hypothetical protein